MFSSNMWQAIAKRALMSTRRPRANASGVRLPSRGRRRSLRLKWAIIFKIQGVRRLSGVYSVLRAVSTCASGRYGRHLSQELIYVGKTKDEITGLFAVR